MVKKGTPQKPKRTGKAQEKIDPKEVAFLEKGQGGKKKKDNRTREFTWTEFDVSQEMYSHLLMLCYHDDHLDGNNTLTYLVFSPEICPKTGRPHIQGYCHTREKVSLKTFRRIMHPKYFDFLEFSKTCTDKAKLKLSKEQLYATSKLRVFPSGGRADQNRRYIVGPWCGVEEGVVKYKPLNPSYCEIGKMPKQGTRNDIVTFMAAARVLTPSQLCEVFPVEFARYHRAAEKVYSYKLNQNIRTVKPAVHWIFGPTGGGKTRYAKTLGTTVYFKESGKWWDGYEHQDVIIIDDFDGEWDDKNLLRLLDHNPIQGEVKGGVVTINSPIIVFTCDTTPQELCKRRAEFARNNVQLAQFLRRIDHMTFIKADGQRVSLDSELEELRNLLAEEQKNILSIESIRETFSVLPHRPQKRFSSYIEQPRPCEIDFSEDD